MANYIDIIKEQLTRAQESSYSLEVSRDAEKILNDIISSPSINETNKTLALNVKDRIVINAANTACKNDGYATMEKASKIIQLILTSQLQRGDNANEVVIKEAQKLLKEIKATAEFLKITSSCNALGSQDELKFSAKILEKALSRVDNDSGDLKACRISFIQSAREMLASIKEKIIILEEKRYTAITDGFYKKHLPIKQPACFSSAWENHSNNEIYVVTSPFENEIEFNATAYCLSHSKTLTILNLAMVNKMNPVVRSSSYTKIKKMDSDCLLITGLNVSDSDTLLSFVEVIKELKQKKDICVWIADISINSILLNKKPRSSYLFEEGDTYKTFLSTFPSFDEFLNALNEIRTEPLTDDDISYIHRNCGTIGYYGLNRLLESKNLHSDILELLSRNSAFYNYVLLNQSYSLLSPDWEYSYVHHSTQKFVVVPFFNGDKINTEELTQILKSLELQEKIIPDFKDFDESIRKVLLDINTQNISVFEKIAKQCDYCLTEFGPLTIIPDMPREELLERLTHMVCVICDWFEMPRAEVELIDDLRQDDGTPVAGLSGSNHIIKLNYDTCMRDPWFILKLVLHESYHQFQQKPSDNVPYSKWMFDYFGVSTKRTDMWVYNFKSYVKPSAFNEQQTDIYEMQIVECDANIFAETVTAFLGDKYINDSYLS